MEKIESLEDFTKHIAKALGWSENQVNSHFDLSEKEGYFIARRNAKSGLMSSDKEKLRALAKRLNGEYIEGADILKFPRPLPEVSPRSPMNASVEPSIKAPIDSRSNETEEAEKEEEKPTSPIDSILNEFEPPKEEPDTTATPSMVSVKTTTPTQSTLLQSQVKEEKATTTIPAVKEEFSGKIVQILIDRIDPSPFQGRITIDKSKIAELAASMEGRGILQPIHVRSKSASRWEVVTGQRRLEAAKKVGLRTVPCIIRRLTDQEVEEEQLTENEQRVDFSDYEKALKYDSMLKKYPDKYPTQEVLAARLGKTRSWVERRLRMLELSNIAPRGAMVILHEGHARAILETPIEHLPQVVKKVTEYVKREGVSPSMSEIKSFAELLQYKKDTSISQTSETQISPHEIKHESVETEHPSEHSEEESCDKFGKIIEVPEGRYKGKIRITTKPKDVICDSGHIGSPACKTCSTTRVRNFKKLKE